MLKSILVILSLAAVAYGSGQLSILRAPANVKFVGDQLELSGSNTGQVFQACMGLSTDVTDESGDKKFGLLVESPFNLAEFANILRITGSPTVDTAQIKPVATIQLNGEQTTIASLEEALKDQQQSTIYLNKLEKARKELKEYFEIDGQVKAAAIKTDLDTCKAIADALDAIKAPKNHPAVLQLALDVTDMTESPDKCLSLVVNAYEAFAKRMQTQAGIFAVFAQETQPQESLRRVRRAAENDSKSLNLAVEYSDDYPVIFNIILWFGVLMVFSLLAISYAIGGMDPGRDSIIYRMTSTRIKKDN